MELRAATPDDAASLAELHVRCWQEAYVGQLPQPFLDRLEPEDRAGMWRALLAPKWPADVFVACDEADELVGFIAVGHDRSGDLPPDVGLVYSIYCRARVWGTGVGRRLMDRGLEALHDRGYGEAVLWVLETNERARRFYEVAGWNADGSRVDEVGGTSVTELRYRLSLHR